LVVVVVVVAAAATVVAEEEEGGEVNVRETDRSQAQWAHLGCQARND